MRRSRIAEKRNVAGVHPVNDVRAREAHEDAGVNGIAAASHSVPWRSVVAESRPRSSTRFGAPAKTAGRKNEFGDAGHRREHDHRAWMVGEGQQREDDEPRDVGAHDQRLSRKPVDQRPDEEADEDPRHERDEEQKGYPPRRVRAGSMSAVSAIVVA